MSNTAKGIYYPGSYASVADVPEDMKKMAESVDEAIENTEVVEDKVESEEV